MKPVAVATRWTVVLIILTLAGVRALADDHLVKIQIDPATTVAKIPEDFIGFGYETSAAAQANFFTPKNERMVRLYQNLTPRGLIRIGGNVSDHTRYEAVGTPAVKTEREVTVINRANLAELGEFARASGWRVMWGLNLGTGTKEQAVEEALAVDQALGASLQSFEIGNEVDLMKKYAKDYDAYHADYLEYKAAIRAKLPGAVFSGPDSASSLAFVERFVATESADMKLATLHYYRGGQREQRSTLDRLLARDEAFDAKLDKLRELCAKHHVEYRINEVNSYSGGGRKDVSDTFGEALWVLDYMFDLASRGCAGVNIETDVNQLGFISFYSPIVHDDRGVCSARPEYYGMLAFAMAGRGEMLKTSAEKEDVNLAAYATRDGDGAVFVTVINKDLTRDATVECTLPSGFGRVDGFRLRAPAVDSKSDVTFAGAAAGEDGGWSAGSGESIAVAEGVARLTVPHASAVVLKCQKR